jgi:hypothetical protein
MSFSDFSSWPREQEQAFVPFEQHVAESQSKAWTISAIVAGVFLMFACVVYFAITPAKSVAAKEAESERTAKKPAAEKAETPAPAAEKK